MKASVRAIRGMAALATLLASSVAQASGSSSSWGMCTDSCHVLGYLKCGQYSCHHFGNWDSSHMPKLSIGLELSSRFFPIQGWSVSGARGKASAPMDSDVFDGSRVVATPIGVRIDGYLTGPLYMGFVMSAGPAFRYGGNSRAPDAVRVTDTTGFYGDIGLALGLALPIRDVTLRGEVLGGGRMMSFGANDPKAATDTAQSGYLTATAATFMVQPRLAADLWVSPWSTMGLFAGTDVLHRSEYILGLSYSFHVRAFDGARDPI